MLTEDGPLPVDIPRDRDGSFAPILIPKDEGDSAASTNVMREGRWYCAVRRL
ncbi:protein of unknown function (plasmid) [Cupriavidus taiwanensis]|uniref:Uncharacterized protein n=1 Tax=Cupriavidus taiwanensis TaxID=164546 RepID=A0A375IVV1_9BURK|nr:protein of unknown function [Cupriavidus taiwanensis]